MLVPRVILITKDDPREAFRDSGCSKQPSRTRGEHFLKGWAWGLFPCRKKTDVRPFFWVDLAPARQHSALLETPRRSAASGPGPAPLAGSAPGFSRFPASAARSDASPLPPAPPLVALGDGGLGRRAALPVGALQAARWQRRRLRLCFPGQWRRETGGLGGGPCGVWSELRWRFWETRGLLGREPGDASKHTWACTWVVERAHRKVSRGEARAPPALPQRAGASLFSSPDFLFNLLLIVWWRQQARSVLTWVMGL